ncbi:TetR family transcriptional regulator [Actinocorallia herbida]|uniref:TetR family transcriptional regulator n=1 Tax=Actinocorallia herbida TaxID=58109 RepID=A0A3N1D7V0_9ACTN|nr:TetR/AcrR family transcriptional regulator [Actinocorallia herbida]ROO89600.1 TetR family transcriptional regulator [Actinocorallia herbida]
MSFYLDVRERGEAALRTGLIDLAAQLLTDEGSSALTMRRMATTAGCSTTVLYRVFGGKDGIADALYREGFTRLKRRLEEAPRGGGPAEHLASLGRAYRDNALVERNLYRVMFFAVIPGFAPDEQARAVARASLDVLRAAVAACAEAGIFTRGTDPDEVTDLLWAASHGALSLELAGHYGGETAAVRYRALTTAAVRAFLADPAAPWPP